MSVPAADGGSGGDVAVVSVTFNSARVLPAFLDSIRHQQTTHQVGLYLVDNASTDATREIIRQAGLPDMRVIHNGQNLGFAAGCNQGIKHALADGYDFVLLLNNDTRFGPDFVQRLLAHVPDPPDSAVIVPRIVSGAGGPGAIDGPPGAGDAPGELATWYAGGTIRRLGLLPTHRYAAVDAGADSPDEVVSYASGCCLLLHRGVIDTVGLLDEDFFVYCEDLDFCLRLQQSGITIVYVPSVWLIHDANSLTGGRTSPFTLRQRTRNHVYVIRKHSSGLRLMLNLAYFQCWIVGRLIFRRDSFGTFRQRQRALLGGLGDIARRGRRLKQVNSGGS